MHVYLYVFYRSFAYRMKIKLKPEQILDLVLVSFTWNILWLLVYVPYSILFNIYIDEENSNSNGFLYIAGSRITINRRFKSRFISAFLKTI